VISRPVDAGEKKGQRRGDQQERIRRGKTLIGPVPGKMVGKQLQNVGDAKRKKKPEGNIREAD